jgi:hypothetical protein
MLNVLALGCTRITLVTNVGGRDEAKTLFASLDGRGRKGKAKEGRGREGKEKGGKTFPLFGS